MTQPKSLNELTKSDLLDIGREIGRPMPKRNEVLEKYFGVPCHDLVVVAEKMSRYAQVVQLSVFESFVSSYSFRITQLLDLDNSTTHPFEYRDIEIEPGKYVKVVDYGYIFMESQEDGTKFAMSISEWSTDRKKARIFALRENQDRALSFLSEWKKYSEKNNILRGKKITPDFTHLVLNEAYTWDSIVLPEHTREELRKNVDLLFGSLPIYKANNMTFKRGLILKGEPGTGKTLIGKILANTLKDVTFIWVTPGHLTDSDNVKATCEMARALAPTVLFLEDVDLYGSHRERENRNVLGELMNQLDGIIENEFVIVVATTNRPDELEGALRNRPGRFDRVLDVPKPDEGCRLQLLTLYTKTLLMSIDDGMRASMLAELANKTDGFTGAHIRELVNTAIITAIDEKSLSKTGKVILRPQHFSSNLDIVKARKVKPVGFGSEAPTKYELDFDRIEERDDIDESIPPLESD